MVDRFQSEDVGRLVHLALDPKQSRIAQLLGAECVEVYGRILEVSATSLTLEVHPPAALPLPSRRDNEVIPYDRIVDYHWHSS